jgi:Tfp pilus assembly protein FimV
MAHLNDRLAEFFYGELPASEMTEARRHVAECAECRGQVEQFQRTHLALRASPDLDPPRQIIFAPPETRPAWAIFDWRVFAPLSTAAAALVIALFVALSPQPAAVTVSAPPAATSAPVVVQAQEVDYERIVNEVRRSERAWTAGELEKRDKEIQRLQGELAYYQSFQRAVMKGNWENGASIQLLAQRMGSQD